MRWFLRLALNCFGNGQGAYRRLAGFSGLVLGPRQLCSSGVARVQKTTLLPFSADLHAYI